MTPKLWASYSQLTAHRKCPQAWAYSFERRLEKDDPLDVKVERDMGSWWHALRAADAIVRGRKHDSLRKVPELVKTVDHGPTFPTNQITVDQVLADSIVWWEQQTPLVQETWIEKLGGSTPQRLAELDDRWHDRWEDEIATEQPLAVEMGWGRDLPKFPGPDGSVTDPNARLVGYIDEVYLDTKRQIVVVRDNKTHKTLAAQTTADDMMDSQLQLYAWGASPEITSWGIGQIKATAYDRIRTVKAKTPSVTQAGTLSKSITDFDLYTYAAWSLGDGRGVPYPGRKADGSGAGFYQPDAAVIEKLSTPAAISAWYQRTLTPLNLNLIRVHLRAAVDSAADVALSRARFAVTGEAARNLTERCRYCDFVRLCRTEMVGGISTDIELSDYYLRAKK